MPRRSSRLLLAIALAASALVGPSAPAAAVNDGPPELVGDETQAWIGELGPPDEAWDHIVLMWDEIIDPTSIPARTDFSVTINDAPVDVLDVELLFSGFADESFGISPDGNSFMRLELDGATWTGADSVLVTYVPDATPVRDLARAEAAGFENVAATTFDPGAFDIIAAVVDSYYGADKLLIGTFHPLDPGSIPVADDFTFTVGGDDVDVQSVSQILPGLGIGLLELQLDRELTDDTAEARLTFEALTGPPLRSLRTGEEIASVVDRPASLLLAADTLSTTVAAGGSASTASPEGPTVADPIGTTVTSPTGGTVAIDESTSADPPTAGYEFFGQQVSITAPPAADADDPLVLRFDIDASLVPVGQDEGSIVIFRNGDPVDECVGAPGVADPTPCVAERLALAEGDISITVLTVEASTWNLGLRLPIAFGGFLQPVDGDQPNLAIAGRAIPVRFSLGGDQGLDIFEPGTPTVGTISCDGLEDGDEIEQTVTAGSSSLTYDAATDTYTYVWRTDRSWTGACKRLVLSFVNGPDVSAIFDFRR